MEPSPTTTFLGGATPVWDSNSADSGQLVEIVEVATDRGYSPEVPLERQDGNRTQQVAAVEELGIVGLIGWKAGMRPPSRSALRRDLIVR